MGGFVGFVGIVLGFGAGSCVGVEAPTVTTPRVIHCLVADALAHLVVCAHGGGLDVAAHGGGLDVADVAAAAVTPLRLQN